MHALTVLDADPDGVDYVHLAWPATNPAPDSYELQGRQGDGAWQLVANQLHETSGRVTFDDAPEGVTFAFRVRSWVGSVASDWSNEVSGSPLPVALADVEYVDSDASRWVDGNVYEYRVTYSKGSVTSVARMVDGPAARPYPPADVYSSGFSDYEGGSFTLSLETAAGEVGHRSPLGAALFQPGVLFDGQNHAHAIWAESGQLATCALHHSSFDGTWHDEVIAQDGCSAQPYRSAAVDSAGALHVAWWKGGTTRVQYASNASGTWKVEDVAPPGVSELLTAGIAVDPNGTPGLVMRAPGGLTSGAVYLVRRAGSGWTVELVPETGLGGSNAVFALALPAADRALIFGEPHRRQL